jgi:chromosomal replication initiator protein
MSAENEQARGITIEAIQLAVARMFGISVKELGQKSTRRTVTVPRQIAMYLARQMTDASIPEIGRKIGGKHHTTVIHSIAKVEEERRTDPAVNAVISKLMRTLGIG